MVALRWMQTLQRRGSRPDPRAPADLWTAPLAALPGLLAGMTTDADRVIRKAGLDPATVADPSRRLPCETVALLLDECVRATRCPHFGLLVGQRSGTAAIGIIADLIWNAGTVGEALRLLSAHIHLADRGLVLVLQVHGARRAELSLVLCEPAVQGAGPYLDAGLAIALSVMRSLCGPAWNPTLVTLARAAPRDVRPYHACYAAPVRFGQTRTALVFAASHLHRDLPPRDPGARRDLLRRVTDLEAALPATATEAVVRVLSGLVMARAPTRAEVADVVGLSSRTLCRRLTEEGTNFRDLLMEVRCGLASQLLEESEMPVADISATLQFSAPGAFTRSFKAWSGRTPAEQRASTRAGKKPAGAPTGPAR